MTQCNREELVRGVRGAWKWSRRGLGAFCSGLSTVSKHHSTVLAGAVGCWATDSLQRILQTLLSCANVKRLVHYCPSWHFAKEIGKHDLLKDKTQSWRGRNCSRPDSTQQTGRVTCGSNMSTVCTFPVLYSNWTQTHVRPLLCLQLIGRKEGESRPAVNGMPGRYDKVPRRTNDRAAFCVDFKTRACAMPKRWPTVQDITRGRK